MTFDHAKHALSTMALAGLLATSANAVAQGAGDPGQAADAPPPGMYGQAPQGIEVDDATIERFAEAMAAVQQLNQELTEEMNSASDTTSAHALQQQAQQDMVEAVEAEGISVREYNEIATAMQQDPELAARVNAAINGNQ